MVVRIAAPENTDSGNIHHALVGDSREPVLLCLDHVETDILHVADCLSQRVSASGIDGSRLELMRNLCPDSSLSCDRFDHLAAGEEGRKLLKKLFLSVKSADPHWSQHLVTGERKEIHAQILYVNSDMRNALGTIADQDHAVAMADLSECL